MSLLHQVTTRNQSKGHEAPSSSSHNQERLRKSHVMFFLVHQFATRDYSTSKAPLRLLVPQDTTREHRPLSLMPFPAPLRISQPDRMLLTRKSLSLCVNNTYSYAATTTTIASTTAPYRTSFTNKQDIYIFNISI